MGPVRVGLRRRAEAPSVPVTRSPRSQSSPVMCSPAEMPFTGHAGHGTLGLDLDLG
jgi:hypothetical protein